MSRKTSSDIPRARQILKFGLDGEMPLRTAIRSALYLMVRRSPDFRAPRECKDLDKKQRQKARMLRGKGLSMLTIANRFGTNPGRVSNAINGKLHKRRGNSRRATF